MPRIIVFDTETTGLPKPKRVPLEEQPKIIEVGAVVVEIQNDKHEIVDKISQLIDPHEKLSEEVKKITKIQDADLQEQPNFAEYYPYLKNAFVGADALICHNAPFDTLMLKNELLRLDEDVYKTFPWPKKIICTVREFHHIFGYNPNLQLLYKTVMGTELDQTHRAVDDAMALADIVIKTGMAKYI